MLIRGGFTGRKVVIEKMGASIMRDKMSIFSSFLPFCFFLWRI